MKEQFARTQLLYGEEGMARLAAARVAVFGIGGVGGHVAEALARSGIGALDLIDSDEVDITNLNRQIIATMKTLGKAKVDAAAERIADIAPDCRVTAHRMFYLPQTKDQFDFAEYDYVVDAIDTVAGKLAIIEEAKNAGVPVISAMGAGNKVNPAAFQVADIYETSVCPLAKVIRRECRKRGIDSLKVVYSREEPVRPKAGPSAAEAADKVSAFDSNAEAPAATEAASAAVTIPGAEATFDSTAGITAAAETIPGPADGTVPATAPKSAPASASGPAGGSPAAAGKKRPPGSTAFGPAVVGLIIAGEVVNDLTGIRDR